MSAADKLHILGQSVCYDNIRRSLIVDGTLMDMIERRDILGLTSNPSIFMKAIANSDDYDADLQTMALAGLEPLDIFYRLAIQDVQDVTDLFRPYYDASDGSDGFVSLEVNPRLARDTEGTLKEALWLWETVDRPNLFVKIPGTKEGLPAITEAIAAGVNINVTLIFSRERYREVMDAYLKGIERRVEAGLAVDGIASCASFFVSRVENKTDAALQAIVDAGGPKAEVAKSLLGRMAVDNIRLAYQDFEEFFSSERFLKMKAFGAQVQRPLWASTGTKNAAYSDIKYVESLVAPFTVNTMPPKTLEAFLDHGDPQVTIYDEIDQAKDDFVKFAELGLSIDEITTTLEEEGLASFNAGFDKLLDVIEERRQEYLGGLGDLAEAVAKRVAQFDADDVVSRIHRIDPTVWTDDPAGQQEVQKRLGWLTLPDANQNLVAELTDFADEALDEDFEKVLLLGMGGSSLAPETMATIFEGYVEGAELRILDSTLPEQVKALDEWVDYGKTLFIVASKSGGTTETMSLFQYFWAQAKAKGGKDTGKQFIAITDPGSKLAALGEENGFRAIFTANPNVGGRYSALAQFGLVPAGLMGVDLDQFLWTASDMASRCGAGQPLDENPGAILGIILGEAALAGRDKLTFLTDAAVAPLGAWLEQLVAESSGKLGKGIVPVADEPQLAANAYGKDRLFAYLRATGEKDDFVADLVKAGQPVVTLNIPFLYDLAGEFYRWEFAIAVACSVIGVNAFDQPDVQDNKDRTKKLIKAYGESGKLDEPETLWSKDGVEVAGAAFDGLDKCGSVAEVIEAFTDQAKTGDYIAINAYLPRNEAVEAKLTALRERILKATGKATTLGFGPRFLHSTGQLHKGGANNGLFLQITQADTSDLEIPEVEYSFSVLARAQALGDLDALLSRDRRVIRINLPAGDELTF
jgi:transaldolase/glucose-6-phosphate isomerase